jgi:hypothetical protein
MNLNFIALKIKNVFYTPPADVTTTKIQCNLLDVSLIMQIHDF